MATENILEAVERIETAISRIERILYGEPPARPNGLLVEFGGLRSDVQGLRADVRTVQNKRPNVPMWVLGYLMFLGSGAFAIVGFLNLALENGIWDLSPWVAFGLAVVFAGIALVMFVGGFRWLDGWA